MPQPRLRDYLELHPPALRRAVSEAWALEWPETDHLPTPDELAQAMLAEGRLGAVVEGLPREAREALESLLAVRGELAAPVFERRFGEARPLGQARLERDRPWRGEALSPAEMLWYRGLVFRRTGPSGLLYVVPPEVRHRLGRPRLARSELAPPAVAEPPAPRRLEPGEVVEVFFRLALALGRPGGERLRERARRVALDGGQAAWLVGMSVEAGLLLPTPDRRIRAGPRLRGWLQAGTGAQQWAVRRAWRESPQWNDLHRVPALRCDPGRVANDPRATRRRFLGHLRGLRPGVWHRLKDLVAGIKALDPDFQRPHGDYHDWYIRDVRSGEYLAGFEAWGAVEGALIRYYLEGPLHWLGMVSLGGDAFELTADGAAFLAGQRPPRRCREPGPALSLRPGLVLELGSAATLYDRFRVEAFAQPGPAGRYHITSSSLRGYLRDGGRLANLVGYLRRRAGKMPAGSVERLRRLAGG